MAPMVNPGVKAKMPTLAVGSKPACPAPAAGFTLIELMVVLVIMALASAGVMFYINQGEQAQLDRDAQRLATLLESARHSAITQGNPVTWQAQPGGFAFQGLPAADPNRALAWLSPHTATTDPQARLTLGPEPVIGPQQVTLIDLSQPQRRLRVSSDGLRPFGVSSESP